MGFEIFHPSHWNFTNDPTGHGFLITIILISSLTLTLLGFLFFRLVCYRERNLPETTSATLTIRPGSIGLDDTTINSLPMFMHRSGSEDIEDGNTSSYTYQESECSICLALYEDEEMVKVMPECQHAFHSDCVDEWLRSRSTCPLCRFSLHSSSSESVLP